MKSSMKVNYNTVDEYMSTLPEEIREKLEKLRAIIRQAAPKARTGSLQVNLEKTQQATKARPALSNAAKPNPRTLAVDRGARPQTTAKPSTGTRVTVSPKAPAATPVKGTPGPPRFGTSHS